MIVVAIIGILAAVAIPQFLEYMNRSKGNEAVINLNALEKSAIRHFIEDSGYPTGTEGATPGANCCTQNVGGGRRCAALDADWTGAGHPVWTSLDFRMTKPFFFQYAYTGEATGQTFTLTATGNTDCDAISAVYTLRDVSLDVVANPELIKPPVRD
ncbi:MAG: type II secretion system protein [Kofleriaceae bacterium]|nr:type II secretion system protein [Kofleriaceae bacterium]MBP9168437.1 type II secretion system protein [Kofleriaceae bacterium]MBP9858885.1 type II secretion system protein [Kofleriaceae bacterium]